MTMVELREALRANGWTVNTEANDEYSYSKNYVSIDTYNGVIYVDDFGTAWHSALSICKLTKKPSLRVKTYSGVTMEVAL